MNSTLRKCVWIIEHKVKGKWGAYEASMTRTSARGWVNYHSHQHNVKPGRLFRVRKYTPKAEVKVKHGLIKNRYQLLSFMYRMEEDRNEGGQK